MVAIRDVRVRLSHRSLKAVLSSHHSHRSVCKRTMARFYMQGFILGKTDQTERTSEKCCIVKELRYITQLHVKEDISQLVPRPLTARCKGRVSVTSSTMTFCPSLRSRVYNITTKLRKSRFRGMTASLIVCFKIY
jgi:hypothetical protein